MNSWRDSLAELDDGVAGPVYTAGDAGYDDELAVFNEAVVHQPAVVVGAASAADVSAAVTFAAHHGLDVAVLNTGHGPSLSAGASSLMITTRRMAEIGVDAANRIARVEAGVRFGELVNAAARHGLAPLPGSAPGVGVVGYTLGGGASATLGRAYGWASDHVTFLDVVTADGQLRRVSPQSEGDLFGALLGGKSNFGVVTAMEFALFPVTRLYAGALFYSGEDARDVLAAYRRFVESAPDEMTTGVALLNFPPLPHLPSFMQGRLVVSVRISYAGDADTGRGLIEPLRRAAPLQLDTVADIPFTQFATITNDPTEPAAGVEHFGLLSDLTEECVDAVVRVAAPSDGSVSHLNIVDIRHLGAAFSQPAGFPNAVGGRSAAFAYFGLTVVPPGHRVDDYRDSGRELTEALAPWRYPQAHPNFLGPADATEAGTREAYDSTTYRVLRTLKAKYDPQNLFRTNHNIPPDEVA